MPLVAKPADPLITALQGPLCFVFEQPRACTEGICAAMLTADAPTLLSTLQRRKHPVVDAVLSRQLHSHDVTALPVPQQMNPPPDARQVEPFATKPSSAHKEEPQLHLDGVRAASMDSPRQRAGLPRRAG